MMNINHGYKWIISFALCMFLMCCLSSYASADEDWLWPVTSKKTTQRYGWNGHLGMDLLNEGETVRATKSGVVVAVFSGCKSYSRAYSGCSGCSPKALYIQASSYSDALSKRGNPTSNSSVLSWTSSKYHHDFCNIGFGNGAIIYHSDGKVSFYAHLSSTPLVSIGQLVNQGDAIGYVGSSGCSTGAHLHFSIADTSASSSGNYGFTKIKLSFINNNPKKASFGLYNTDNPPENVYDSNGIDYITEIGKKLEIRTENGKVTGSHNNGSHVAKGTTISLTATPDENYVFSRWEVTGTPSTSSVTNSTLTFTMPNNDVTLTAFFNIKPGATIHKWTNLGVQATKRNATLSASLIVDKSNPLIIGGTGALFPPNIENVHLYVSSDQNAFAFSGLQSIFNPQILEQH